MNRHMSRAAALAVVAIGCSLPLGVASADLVKYQLHNHPDGSASTPAYGLRLDELHDVTTGHDVFTFDFDHASSSMQMDIDLDAGTLRIYGNAQGGRDVGSAHAPDQYNTIYTIDMLYNVGVSTVPGDDDIWVTADSMNAWGTILDYTGNAIPLTNLNMGGFSLRIGDEDNDLGHRGFDGVSGWGWVNHGEDPTQHVESSDWLFTATPGVPAPGAASLFTLALAAAARRRRSH